MSKTADLDYLRNGRVFRGTQAARRATSRGINVKDTLGGDVEPVWDILFDTGFWIEETEDGVTIHIGGGTSGPGGASGTAIDVLNNSDRDLIVGDIVVTDDSADRAVTTTTTPGDLRNVGVVQEPIAAGFVGKVLFEGYAPIINAPDAVRGEYALTSATEAEADSTPDRGAGTFAYYWTGAEMSDFVAASARTVQALPVVSLEIGMPPSIPADRELLLAAWVDDSVASALDVPGWIAIGSSGGGYVFRRASTGSDAASASWTGASPAFAAVLVLHPNVSLAVPVEDSDFDTTTAAASLSGLSDVAHYAVAMVDADVASPGSGFDHLAGGSAGFDSSGSPSLVQSKEGDKFGTTLDAAPATGNLLLAVTSGANALDVYESDPRQPGTCPEDVTMTNMARNVHTPSPSFMPTSIQGKTLSDTYAGPYNTSYACTSGGGRILLMEWENLGVGGFLEADDNAAGPLPPPVVDLGDFGAGPDDVCVMSATFTGSGGGGGADPQVDDTGWTVLHDALTIYGYWWWVGYKIGDGDASFALSNAGGHSWGAAAVLLTQGTLGVAGTLAGKYIGHDSGVTSPFSGGSQQNDGVIAFDLLRDAQPSALLYGPDLGAATGGSISIVDAGGYFTGTNVEDVLQELASKDIGSQNHNSMGSTETFSALTGWHYGTFDADCTFTFSGATSGLVASMVLELTEDGTGGWQPTWPGSVVWPGGSAPTHDDTAGTTTLYLFESRDGGSTWYGFQAGSGTTITFGMPAIVLGTAAAAGSIDEVIRRDATIVAFDATAPTTSAEGDSAATGSAAVAARRDHRHGREAFGTTAQAIGTSAGGSATTPSKSDHVHATGAGTPSTSAIGDAAATGTGPAAAMTDHVHGREALSTATPLVESGSGAVGTATKSSREDHVHPASSGGGASFIPIGQETRISDGSTTTWTLDNDFEENSVQAFNLTSGLALSVTETLPNSVTISAAGTAGNTLSFAYAASVV